MLVVSEEDPPLASHIVSRVMGVGHGYWAGVGEARGTGLVAWSNGVPLGAAVYYEPVPGLAIVYYVAVVPAARGAGLGRILVSSVEEHSGAEAFLATIGAGNKASLRMFQALGYETGRIRGDPQARGIIRAACADDDEYYAGKGAWRELVEEAASIHGWSLCTPPEAGERRRRLRPVAGAH